jgi:hypothetical protein
VIRLSLSEAEAFLLLLCLESFLPESSEPEAEALENLLGKLQSLSPSAPFSSAKEAREKRFQSP